MPDSSTEQPTGEEPSAEDSSEGPEGQEGQILFADDLDEERITQQTILTVSDDEETDEEFEILAPSLEAPENTPVAEASEQTEPSDSTDRAKRGQGVQEDVEDIEIEISVENTE